MAGTSVNIIKPFIVFSFLFLSLFTSCYQEDTKKSVCLSDKWEFYFAQDDKWYPASVPGNIHTDLYYNELIPDPFFESNSDSLEWISNSVWKYRRIFNVPKEALNANIELVFEGLDTYAKLIINDIEIGNSFNMYRKWVFPISDSCLNEGENTLEVEFTPSSQHNLEKESSGLYAIPDNRTLTRKAPYQYGWDWAPNMETCGIYKKVYLNFWKKIIIRDFKLEQKLLTDSLALINAVVELESENYYNGQIKIFSDNNEFDTIVRNLEIFEGKYSYPIEIDIKNPKLWWCNGMGEPFLYNVKVQISTKFRQVEESSKLGLRNIQLETNSDEYGQEFYFKLNGEKVFAKGANWVPAEYFNGQNDPQNYYHLLKMAKDANFNMLRVWGGGIYENDDFYNICDSLGIMIWQDFMFACAFYPLNDSIITNINNEIEYQVNRLYNHPSIVLWCGNNEISNAWFDWGWQKEYNMSPADSIRIWKDYDTLFHRIIPNQILKFDNTRRYVPSSPFFGWGRPQSLTHGDSHYWGVWWGEYDFNTFFDKTGRFMSEYGFQAYPSMSSIRKFISSDSLFISSKSLQTHQKHPRGKSLIDNYLKNNNNITSDINIEDYVYLSQVLQAEGIQMAYDAHLSSMPYCMGTLFWQYNDCWPVISWSAVDYYKQPKALYFYTKKAFENIFISTYMHNDSLNLSIINHYNYDISSSIIVDIIDYYGDVIVSDTSSLKLINKCASDVKLTKINNGLIMAFSNTAYLRVRIFDLNSSELLSERCIVLLADKSLTLPQANPQIICEKGNDYWIINIMSNVLIKNMFLWVEDDEGYFSDNYFYVEPNKQKEVKFFPKSKNPIKKLSVKFKSINDFVSSQE